MATPTQSQFSIQLNQSALTQTLAPAGGASQKWSFPVNYNVSGSTPPAVAEIEIDGTPTQLQAGSQTIQGTGSEVAIKVQLGSSQGVKVQANPYNAPDCPYPVTSEFAADGSNFFQFACTAETTSLLIDVTLEFEGDIEQPAPTADVALYVNGASYQAVPSGSSSYTPSGTTFAFAVTNFQGSGLMNLVYSYGIN